MIIDKSQYIDIDIEEYQDIGIVIDIDMVNDNRSTLTLGIDIDS